MVQRAILVAALLIFVARAGVAGAQVTGGGFAGTPNFGSSGQASAVFLGGSVDQLETAARDYAATGVWVQDASGVFQLLIAGGPAFLRDAFTSRFPGGFAFAIAVTLTRPPGAPSAPPSAPPATPPRATPLQFPNGVPGPSTND